jgi:uncharacterized membrane protein YcjF (UPF0283 family)
MRLSNMTRLVIEKMAVGAIPEGAGFPEALGFLADGAKITAGAHAASEWVRGKIQEVRDAPGRNTWKDKDDEAIAGEILRRLYERRILRQMAGQKS